MGFRTEDEDGALDTMSLDEYVIENREATYILRAKSDAMKGEGILYGDLLVVDRSKTPQRSDIVIAVRDGEFVMRRLSEVEDEGIQVEAVVTAVIRKY
jgi:DNA polymerase V